jgi:FecR protein
MKNRFAFIIGTVVLGASLMAGAQVSEDIPGLEQGQPQAQAPQGQDQAQAEPSSSVARISLMHGDVSTQRGDSGDWATAAVNQPMVSSDKISTGANSRAEVQLDSANILRLGDSTLASIAGLSRNQIQVQLERGLIDYSVFKGTEAEVEIDTANAAVRPVQNDGIYRVEINAEGETLIIVRKGSAEIATPQGSTQVEKGQMAIVRGTGADTQYKLADAPSNDSWDSWNNERNRLIYDAQSWGKTNRYYTGSEDLDTYGRWTTVPEYGPVWTPVVTPGWAPYRSGRWVWEPGWGWTWVSYEPWGWAPYHYGRWFVYNSSWVWWPGPAYGYPRYRPVWAPAYVSFFGFGGGGVGVGFGFGSVGWLPIGPCDRFYPWYGRHGSRYNVVNVTNINIYNGRGRGFGGIAPLRAGGAYSNLRLAAMNDRVRGGISTVPTGQFGTGRSTPVGVNGETFRGGHLIAGSLPVVPTRSALSVSNRPAAASTIPRGGGQQRFFSKTRPAAAPQSFDRQVTQMRQSMQRNGAGVGQSFSRGERSSQNAVGATGAAQGAISRPTPGVRTPSSGGFNNSNAQQAQRGASLNDDRTGRPTTSDGSGWRRFSDTNTAQRDGAMNRPSGMSPGVKSNNVPRPGNSAAPASNNESWRHFTPRSGGNVQGSPDRGNNGGGMYGGRGSGPEFQRNEMSRPQVEPAGGGRSMVQDSPRGYSRPPLEMRQPIVTPRSSEVRGSAPRESSPSRNGGGGGGGGGNRGGSGGGGSHGGGGPHGGSGRR